MARLKYISLLFFFCITSSLFAQGQEEQEIKFETDSPEKIYAGERFRLIYKLTNADVSDIDFPKNIKGFEIIYGPSKSSSYSSYVTGGKTTSTSVVSFTVILLPTETGKYKLPEVTIEVKGKKYKAKPSQIEVVPAEGKTGKNRTESPQNKKKDNRQNKKEQEITDKDAFIKAHIEQSTVDDEKIFEVTLRLYFTDKISGISRIPGYREPDFSAFRIVGRGSSDRRIFRTEYDGKQYYAVDIHQFVLIPKRSGKINIDGGSFDIVFLIKTGEVEQSFFGPVEKEIEVNKTIKTESFSIDAGLAGNWQTV